VWAQQRPGLNEATVIAQKMADQSEAKELRRHLGQIMAKPPNDIVAHIVRQCPDLDPDKDT
jgi:hypothetical protein